MIVILFAIAYGLGWHRELSFETLIRNHAAIHGFVTAHEALALTAFFAIYVLVVSLSLPGGAILSVIGGYLFGPVLGGGAAYLGALAGATIIFLLARSAVGEFLTRRAGRFAAKLADGFRADAFNYLLFLRLVPFPFWLVNLAPALFAVSLRTFIAATAIGIVPATLAYSFFGASLGGVMAAEQAQYDACLAAGRSGCSVDFDLSHVFTPTLLVALAAIGVLALIPVGARRVWRRKMDVPSNTE
jgi:uncharacterized membrane protein YdjX (TVP38/TMEM64 family)